MREEWDDGDGTVDTPSDVMSDLPPGVVPAPDAYCFEMLSMVLALSGSTVGRQYLAQQYGLLRDLITFLHTGSARVQRQVSQVNYHPTHIWSGESALLFN